MAIPTFFAKTGSTPTLSRTLLDSTGTPIPIAPGAVKAVVTLRVDSTDGLFTFSAAMTNLDTGSANTGQVQYTFRSTDIPTAGIYNAEYDVVYQSGSILKVPDPGYELFQWDVGLP